MAYFAAVGPDVETGIAGTPAYFTGPGGRFDSPWTGGSREGWNSSNIDTIFEDIARSGIGGQSVGAQTLAGLRQAGVSDEAALNALWAGASGAANPYWTGGSPTGIMRGIWEHAGVLGQLDNPSLVTAQQQQDQAIWQMQQQNKDSDFGPWGMLAGIAGSAFGMPWLGSLVSLASGNFNPLGILSSISGLGGVSPVEGWENSWGDIGGLSDVGGPLLSPNWADTWADIGGLPQLSQLADSNWADSWADIPGLSTSGAFPAEGFFPGVSSFGRGIVSTTPGSFGATSAGVPGMSPTVAGGASSGGLSALYEQIFGQIDPELKKKLGLGMSGASALLSLLSAGAGLKGAKDIRAAASGTPQMAPIYDPFASQRGFYQQQLQGLASDPSKVFELPGYKAGEQALMRQLAAGGYLGSGNMAVALRDYGTKAYGEEFDRLAGLAGARIGPMVAGSAPNPYAGAVAANDATSRALASLGYLARMW